MTEARRTWKTKTARFWKHPLLSQSPQSHAMDWMFVCCPDLHVEARIPSWWYLEVVSRGGHGNRRVEPLWGFVHHQRRPVLATPPTVKLHKQTAAVPSTRPPGEAGTRSDFNLQNCKRRVCGSATRLMAFHSVSPNGLRHKNIHNFKAKYFRLNHQLVKRNQCH